jgi:hypothetical protein
MADPGHGVDFKIPSVHRALEQGTSTTVSYIYYRVRVECLRTATPWVMTSSRAEFQVFNVFSAESLDINAASSFITPSTSRVA